MSPATVATGTDDELVNYPFQRKGFYAAGLFWAFYGDGSTNAVYEHSHDGITWDEEPIIIGPCKLGYGHNFSVWFDGTYVHYARTNNYDLFYRRGTPENDGTITWSAVEQTLYDGVIFDEYIFPCICVDTNGYAWIGVRIEDTAPWDRPYILKNANLDGTWADDVGAGFPYELSAVDDYTWKVAPVPLTDGKVYVVYCRDAQAPLGKLYDAGWGAEESDLADYGIEESRPFSAVALGDNVHFVYNRDATYQIRYNKRIAGSWGANDVLVQDSVTFSTGPALSADLSTGTLYCFWTDAGSGHVYYKKYSAGSWDVDPTDWIDESTDEIMYDWNITSYYQDYGGYIGVLYVTKLATPWNVRFALALSPPVPTDVTVEYILKFGE